MKAMEYVEERISFFRTHAFGWEGELAMAQALKAVLEIHKPMGFLDICESCEEREYQGGEGYEVRYPCPTVTAIEKALGVGE